MSYIYNVECITRVQAQGVSLEGGAVISATPGKLVVCQQCTNILAIYGLYDSVEEEFWTAAAQVTGTLFDEFGNTIVVVPLSFSGGNGVFAGEFGDFNFLPTIGRGYTFLIQASFNGEYLTVPILTEVTAPRFAGVVPVPTIPSP